MSAKFAVLLGLVVIDSLTKGIRFVEAGTPATVEIAEGVYFVRGNGGATDLLAAIKTALESISGTNTYSVTIDFDTDYNNPTAEVTITRASGTNDFSILWSDALTTFDPALIGFERTDSAHDATAKVSTLSPSAVWTSNNVVRRLEPMPATERTLGLSRGNVARAVERSSSRGRLWMQDLIHAQRMKEEYNATDPTAALERFLARHADGKRFEFHEADINTGTILEDLTATLFDVNNEDSGTRVGTFIFDDGFYPRRGETFASRRDDSPLYSFTGYLVQYHVDDVEEVVLVAGAIYVFDPDDASTLTLAGSSVTAITDALGGGVRRMIPVAGVLGSGLATGPTLQNNVVNGRDVIRFIFDGGGTNSNSLLAAKTLIAAVEQPSTGAWFTGVNNAQIPAFTRYYAIKFTSIRTAAAGNDDTDSVWAGNLQIFSLYVRETAGVRYARAKVRVSAVAKDVETSGLALSTWHVITVRGDASTIEIRIDDGAWASSPTGGTIDSTTTLYTGVNGSNSNGFSGDVAFAVDYATRHSDDEADAVLSYIQSEILGQ